MFLDDLELERLAQKRRRRIIQSGGTAFDAAAVTGGAVTAWLRNTTLSGDITSVTDLLNTNPATQAQAGRYPQGNADGSMTFTDDALAWPIHASNNPLVTWGFAAWIQLTDLGAATKTLIEYGSPTAASFGAGDSHKLSILGTEALQLEVALDATGANRRTATSNASVITSGVHFVTCECRMNAATEAEQVVMTLDGAALSLTFAASAGTAAAMPVALQGAAATISIGNQRSTSGSSSNPMLGKKGRNIYVIGSATAAATALLTPAALTALMNNEPLT